VSYEAEGETFDHGTTAVESAVPDTVFEGDDLGTLVVVVELTEAGLDTDAAIVLHIVVYEPSVASCPDTLGPGQLEGWVPWNS